MPSALATRQLLAQYTADLPTELLQEVLDYVQFLRLKRLPDAPADVLRTELQLLHQQEWQHLDQEFKNLDQLYPQQS